ncbi:hypothetical protein [Eudoraea sp.]|uniref:hypothetical protein n=1 Tax=Eudoraea sp. TaxID=1979955 RepID=UPI003C756F64
MKHLILVFIFTLFGMGSYAQEGLKLGLHAGLPIDDFNDEISLMVGLDLGYMWALGEVVDLGISTGLIYGFKDSFQSDEIVSGLTDVQFVPLAASLRIWPSNSFSFGIDGGYGLGLNKGNEGGIYYRPIIGVLLGPMTEINLSYTGIQLENRTWNTVTLGFLHTFQFKDY